MDRELIGGEGGPGLGYPHPPRQAFLRVQRPADVPGESHPRGDDLHVRNEIGPIAQPDEIQWAPSLPKTRSGKIMRRILRKIAAKEIDQIGDTSTLADPSVVQGLVDSR